MAPAQAQNAAEYGLLVAVVAVLVLVGAGMFGALLEPWFNHLIRVVTTGR